MKPIYDIEFIIPVADHGHYFNRALNLKKYGILNCENKRAKLTLLMC